MTNGTLRIEDALIYGIVFDARVRGMALIEVEYRRMILFGLGATVRPHYQAFRPGRQLPRCGRTGRATPRDRAPLRGCVRGLTLINPHTAVDDEVRFSLALEGGVKVFFSKHVGLRAQARLTTTFFSDSSTIFCGTSGCAFGLGGAGLLQGDFGLGAVATW